MPSFISLFRFRDQDGNVHFGEAGASQGHTHESLTGRSVPIFSGENPWDDDFVLSTEHREVVEVG